MATDAFLFLFFLQFLARLLNKIPIHESLFENKVSLPRKTQFWKPKFVKFRIIISRFLKKL